MGISTIPQISFWLVSNLSYVIGEEFDISQNLDFSIFENSATGCGTSLYGSPLSKLGPGAK